MWQVKISSRVNRRALKQLSKAEYAQLLLLIKEIEVAGPVRHNWKNYSKLQDGYHCHLSYSTVACWRETKRGIEIEVYYAGSREGAPY